MKKLFVIAAATVALALVAPPALAYPPWVLVIRDCAADGKLDGTYRPTDLATALRNVPSDGGEYTDCANAISHALAGGSGKQDVPPTNGIVTESGAVASSPDDIAQLQGVIAAANPGEPPPPATVARPGTQPSYLEAALGGLDRSSGPPYRVNTTLLAAVLAGELVVLAGAGALRLRRRRAARLDERRA
jgi:hypothetical protein